MIYFISDLHFGHGGRDGVNGVLKYCNRPFKDVDEMNEELVKRWNQKIKPEDTVYVLGDMALCPYKEFEPIAKRLNGIKYLIKGNHDSYSDSQYNRLGFTVFQELRLNLVGHKFRLSHYPYKLPWYKRLFAFKSELRYMERRPPKIEGEWLLHGHTHSKQKINGNRLHVGVDAWDFYPISIAEIESLIAKSNKNK